MKANRIAILCVLLASVCFGEAHWVWFVDKGVKSGSPAESAALTRAQNKLSARCIERRAKVREFNNIVDYGDIDVYGEYLDAISSSGAEIRVVSRWLNAASIDAPADVLSRIADYRFVDRITPVNVRRETEPPVTTRTFESEAHYGNSYAQNKNVNTIPVHRLGYDGSGVLICITDTGFKLDHEAMASTDIIAKYDFIGGDTIVSLEPGDAPASETHGTKTWSIMAGYDESNLIGIAHAASFMLARTEDYDMEDPIEEDFWIAAAEWADSAGTDIITLSLGYYEWYTPDSMTGDIAPISIAADRMASLGIVITSAAGNNGPGSSTITAPGDADSIITVGAVNAYGTVASFSSRGPTADSRIKPEIVALGTGVWCATSSGVSTYGYGNGTSVATPIVAGISALLLQARPYLGPMDVREAFMNTASRRTAPNNDVGWGVPNLFAALSYPIAGRAALPLFAGWNLVSIPVDEALPVDSVFADRVGDVWHWNPDSSEYESITMLQPGKGYFVLYDRDTLVSFAGDPLVTYSHDVTTGWHAVGGIRGIVGTSAIGAISTADIETFIYRWDPLKQEYSSVTDISPGAGAFILVTSAGELNLME